MPGYARWGTGLDALVERAEPIWVFGALGSGVSTLARILAERRQVACFDDAERVDSSELSRWLGKNPRGIFASHLSPEAEMFLRRAADAWLSAWKAWTRIQMPSWSV
ncbi:MAG: hypothetical protein IPP78_08915 [Holophagaceae bacterium]|nr:hypothetical protein [Holophagaceae bacterium]